MPSVNINSGAMMNSGGGGRPNGGVGRKLPQTPKTPSQLANQLMMAHQQPQLQQPQPQQMTMVKAPPMMVSSNHHLTAAAVAAAAAGRRQLPPTPARPSTLFAGQHQHQQHQVRLHDKTKIKIMAIYGVLLPPTLYSPLPLWPPPPSTV